MKGEIKMFIRLLHCERLKLKRSPIWIAFFIMPVVPALLGTLNYLNNLDLLQSNWYSLWTQHTIFTCYIFMPILIGVYCAYLMRLEYSNHNWNKLLTMPVWRGGFFLSKLTTAAIMILLSEIWIGICFVVSGRIAGIEAAVPYFDIIKWCAFGTLGGIVIAALQLFWSLYIRSFALPVGIALGGGLSGLVFLAKGYGHIWPYSLMAYGMNSNAPQQLMKNGTAQFVTICIVYVAVLALLGSTVLSKRDN